jgi:hypothetical protein
VGDILQISIGCVGGSGITYTTPGGWTALGSQTNSGTALAQKRFWKVATSTEVSTGYVDVAITSCKASATSIALSGALNSAPTSNDYIGKANSSSKTITTSGTTANGSRNGCWIINGDMLYGGNGTAAATNYTNGASSSGGAGASYVESGVCYQFVTAQTYQPATTELWTGTAAVNIGGAVFIPEALSGSGAVAEGSTNAGTGTETFSGSGSVASAATANSGSGSQTFSGSGSVASAGSASSGTGLAGVIGSGAVAAGAANAGSGTETFGGSGAVAGAASVSGSGLVGSIGAGAVAAASSSAGSGTETFGGSASLSMGSAVSGSGLVGVIGSGALAADSATAGSGTETFAGSGALVFSSANSGTGEIASTGITGVGAVEIGSASAGLGALVFAGAASLGAASGSAGTADLIFEGPAALAFLAALEGSGHVTPLGLPAHTRLCSRPVESRIAAARPASRIVYGRRIR